MFSFLFLVLVTSAVYLQAGDEIEVPSELEIASSQVREWCDSWISRVGPLIPRNGDFSSGNLWQAPSETNGLGSSVGYESDPKLGYAVSDAIHSSSSISPILHFDSSVSTSLFRTWGNLTLQGGSTLPYLILNTTLWDGDRLVEGTRYMMIEVEPGESHDFDICENCRLSPERSYSCLLEVEEPEELFVSEWRDCQMAEEDPKAVIWGGSGATYGREAALEESSVHSPSPSGSTKVASTSSPYKSTGTSQEAEDAEDSPEDFELADRDRSSDAVYQDLKKSDEPSFDEETGSISGLDEEISDANSGSCAEDRVQLPDIEEPETEGEDDYEGYYVGDDYYVGSATSDKYHRPDCSYAKKIKPENKVFFSDVREAQEAGYSPCKVCNPQ